MMMVVYFQMSGYRTFKHFYLRHVVIHWRPQFPCLPSYNRFVELMAEVLNPLTAFMYSRCGKMLLSIQHRYVSAKTSVFHTIKPLPTTLDAVSLHPWFQATLYRQRL
jgi:hypothetical protein